MSILGDRLEGARVLDLFAGGGALGLESLSRGAVSVDFVDLSPRSLAALRENIATLDVADVARVHRGDALRFVTRLEAGAFDIALADPPYTMPEVAGTLIERFRAVPFAETLAVEHAASASPAGDETRRYGDTAITFCYAP